MAAAITQLDVGRAGRHYRTPDGLVLPSVTTILGCIGKPALIHWAANQERTLVIEAAAALWEDVPAAGKKMSRTAYVATLTDRIGKTKAHQRELAKAGEIGSEAHALIEWNLRRELGQTVGPAPRVSDTATWAFMVYEEWKKSAALTPKAIEQVVWHGDAGYAGTMDLLAEVTLDDERVTAVLDWKTGKAIYPEALLQNAAYVRALIAMGHLPAPCHGVIVRLPKVASDPAFEVRVIRPAEQDALFLTFLAVKALWDWQQEQEARRGQAGAPAPAAPTAAALVPAKAPKAPVAVPGIDIEDAAQALTRAIEAERARLPRQLSEAEWERLCAAVAGTAVLDLADPAALQDLLTFIRALVAKEPAACARARTLLGAS